MAVALTASMAVMAVPAGAATLLTCSPPSGSVSFSPGLTSKPAIQTTTFNLPIKGCKGTKGVTSGTSKGSSKGTKAQTCLTFAAAGNTSTTVTITWNNKKTSSAKLATKIVKGAPNVITATVSGKITKGLFVGKTLKTTVKVTIPAGACTTKALKSAKLTGLKPVTIG
jgi:hypothetical protein